MALEIEENLRKYLRLTEDGKSIEEFITPPRDLDQYMPGGGEGHERQVLAHPPRVRNREGGEEKL